MKRAARSMRSGSSLKDSEGASGVRSRELSQVGDAVEGVDQLQVGQREGHGVDGEVPAGQVGLDGVGEHHIRLAARRLVGVGAMGGDLHAPVAPAQADRAEPLALGPHRIGPAGHDPLDLVRPGIGREIQVGRRTEPPEHGVAHDAPDQVETVPAGREQRSQLARLLDQWPQPLRYHDRSEYRGAADRPQPLKPHRAGIRRSGSARRSAAPPGSRAGWWPPPGRPAG